MAVTEQAAPPKVPEEAITDLLTRLERYRPVEVPKELETGAGVDRAWLDALVSRWRGGYDWREHEARIRSWPWELVDGETPLRVLHQRVSADAPTVLLLHGWPDSVLRFEKVLPLLSEYNVVVPALPGFPFSAPSSARGMSATDMAEVVAQAMESLGYNNYVVSAGDVGSDVAELVIRHHTDSVPAAHLTDVSQLHFLQDLPADLTEEERAYVGRGQAWQAAEGGYMHEQSTKPATLAIGLGDSPVGLLGWIGEKLWSWSDHDDRDISTVFTPDEVLTWVSAYWFGENIGTSFAPYALKSALPNEHVATPVVLTIFPKDLANAPRSFAERLFDVRSFQELPRGGHFAAWEQPEQYVAGVRAAVAIART
ncbi:epoxide hydrolase [Amycolatopsis sp. NBC_00345]|uniref:epoxide hydrolase family protein n=1 Tax=Amycolatopsis sp. NBC_00345 TaxID=2975955 RepID=UPI002E26EE45